MSIATMDLAHSARLYAIDTQKSVNYQTGWMFLPHNLPGNRIVLILQYGFSCGIQEV